eukprot:GHVL01022686.1.p1 GENE.GHVL01022686.1~~GHVL01022686.1.p1  ORF type:complete len:700 (+),score=110.31 GHVL01022686.1:1102-3201(+)
MVRWMDTNDKLPVIIFAFSRAKCDYFSRGLRNIDVTSSGDKSRSHVLIKKWLSQYTEDDRSLPQVLQMTELASRGIGVHHGGLLPLVKEMTEILFSMGLIKILFATETFAMGVNMPARSVVFSSIMKSDGSKFRSLLPQEFTQMAGRAGRRGRDPHGNVYCFAAEELPNQVDITNMFLKQSNDLKSHFKLTYQMILQLSRSPQVTIEEMMAKSFREARRSREQPKLQAKIDSIKEKLENLPTIECLFGEPDIESYVNNDMRHRIISSEMYSKLVSCGFGGRVFNPGRILNMHSLPGVASPTWGVVIHGGNYKGQHVFDVLVEIVPYGLNVLAEEDDKESGMLTPKIIKIGEILDNTMCLWDGSDDVDPSNRRMGYSILSNVPLNLIACITNETCSRMSKYTVELLCRDDAAISSIIQELESKVACKNGLELIKLEKDMKQIETAFLGSIVQHRSLYQNIRENKCHRCVKKSIHYKTIAERNEYDVEKNNLELQQREESLGLMPQLKAKINVLKELGYISKEDTITMKGQATTEITHSDELSLTEMLLNNTLQDMTPAEAAAVLSAFVFPDKCNDATQPLTEIVENAKKSIMDSHNHIENLGRKYKVEINSVEYRSLCNFGLSNVVYEWAIGTSFTEITKMTNSQEGQIVRAIVRLDELVRNIMTFATRIGDSNIQTLMKKISESIRRDIVFAVSLYITA